MKFLTGYDYHTRWGFFGKLCDKLFFRPWMTWAPAWSFDCLKNRIEKGWHPQQAVNAQIICFFSVIALSMSWIYQGLVPKLLYSGTGELEMLKNSILPEGSEKIVLTFIGVSEILFGMVILFFQ